MKRDGLYSFITTVLQDIIQGFRTMEIIETRKCIKSGRTYEEKFVITVLTRRKYVFQIWIPCQWELMKTDVTILH